MIAKTTLLIMALMTTVVSISAEGLERSMKCIWVSVSSRHNAKEQDIVSRANQYLGRTIHVEIDSIKNIHNTYYVDVAQKVEPCKSQDEFENKYINFPFK